MNVIADLFPGFAEHRIKTHGAEIFVRAIAGKYTIIEPGNKCNFNPLQLPDTPENASEPPHCNAIRNPCNGSLVRCSAFAVGSQPRTMLSPSASPAARPPRSVRK